MRLLPVVALAGCLEPAPPPAPAPEPTPRLMKPIVPAFGEIEAPPKLSEAELRFDDEVDLRPAVSDGRIALVPFVTKEPSSGQHFITLQAGMASGEVVVTDSGVVETIFVSNRSSKPLAILGGELVIGGRQDRLIRSDLVIAPHQTRSVGAICAEPGRMNGGALFYPSRAIAEPTLRRFARANDQFGVWDRLRAVSGDNYRDAAAQQRRGVNADRLRNLIGQLDTVDAREERGQTLGFAVAIDNKLVAIERFPSPQAYVALRAMVIASYLPGSVGRPREAADVDADDVRSFAQRTGALRRPAAGPAPRRNRAAAPSADSPVPL